MLFTSTTANDLMAGVGNVSTDVFSTASPFLFVFIGIPLAFFLLQGIIRFLRENTKEQQRVDKLFDKAMQDSLRLWK